MKRAQLKIVRMAGYGLSIALGTLGALLISAHAGAGRADTTPSAESAAKAFLASLPAELRKSASFALDSPERQAWYFVPRERVGVSVLQLDDAQSELLGPLLSSALSPEGLLTARDVIKHENILRRIETEAAVTNGFRRDPGLYYTSVFGTPGTAAPWAWRFEGHHLSINVTQLPGQPAIVAPIFVGANPARVPSGAQAGYRMLAAEEDLGRELITMLPEARRKVAVIDNTAYPDIVTGNAPKVGGLEIAGLAAADMSAEEQAQLRRLIELYLARLAPASAKEALMRIDRAGFAKVHFAWAGGLSVGEKHYYRVHGPTLLIEYDNTQNDANHIHTVYRDLERDFGGDVLRQHLATAHLSNPRLSN